jgi:hypothetical protein
MYRDLPGALDGLPEASFHRPAKHINNRLLNVIQMS